MLSSVFKILVLYILVNNYVLGQFLGICPLIGVSTKTETAAGMGVAVTFVITIASIVTYFIQKIILTPLGLEYTQTIVFILVIATLVQFVEMVLKKMTPGLYSALGVFLPLITTNCVVLGVAIANIQKGYNLVETIASAIGSSLGFFIAIVLLAAIREKLELSDIPKSFRGVPIALVTIGLMAMSFLGFTGLVK
ncbi:RnfABCDGE type electron transport complex subunit A [Peptostreptococcaceae bacterium OttesenSCG-928-C18]|nr:RnfABCDGE type electron transport complex subunit A [Peptostreptococcaceae bacterium OttesenSCG-928-C18]